jgi:hypothetical protein
MRNYAKEGFACPNRHRSAVIMAADIMPPSTHRGDFPMQYMLSIYADEAGFEKLTPEQQKQGYAAYMAYTDALKQANAFVASGRLRPSSTATTVRQVDGKRKLQDGPFIDAREQFGGYFLIDAADLDTALTWAARCPGASHGAIEVRPIWQM